MEFSRRRFTLLGGGVAAGLLTGAAGQLVGAGPAAAAPLTPDQTGLAARSRPGGGPVTFDKYSLLVDGARTPLWSGEFHPFRLPSPQLWRDILQKFRASGFNAVSIYLSWNFHSPAPGSYDFTGVRDVGAMLDMAAEAGLFVIARPGPYINAEVDGGGFPGWLAALPGTARSDDPAYLGHVDEWLTAVDEVIAPRQYTTGGGTVLLYQLENEYAAHVSDGTGAAYLSHLYAKVRADGITVPLFHNDKGRNGYWVPGTFPTDDEEGRYLYGFDGYPSPTSTPPDWGYFGTGGPKGGATASPDTPGLLAEFGGGWFDCWGGAEFDGRGYEGSRESRNALFERRFYLTNLANGIKIHNVYMIFGGTSWGWLPAPVVYTSYDYGAAIDEGRGLTGKIPPMKQMGLMLEAVPELAALDRAEDITTGADGVRVYHLTSPGTDTHVYVLRNDAADPRDLTLPMTTAAGTVDVPVRLAARDARLLATGITLGARRVHHTTAQPMVLERIGGQDVGLFVARPGDPVELALACPHEPTVTVLDGTAQTEYDATAGVLRVRATLSGLIRLRITGDQGSDAAPVLLLLADDDASTVLWRPTTASGAALVRGPALVRTARVAGTVLHLTGDTTTASDLEVWAPAGVTAVRWNDRPVTLARTTAGSLAARTALAGPERPELPALTGWLRRAENPESAPDYDDSGWPVADRTASSSTTQVPAGSPVLFADDYGFHYGDVWYRATFTGPLDATAVELDYQTGTQGLLMAWLDGVPLGTHRMPVPTKEQATTGTWSATATLPLTAVSEGSGAADQHVLAVLVRRMAHDEDGGANDAFKAARGLLAARFAGSGPDLTWRIQGATGTADPVRGPLNTGGLHGERAGWHLPEHGTAGWLPTDLPYSAQQQGVTWYRTDFRLAVSEGVDASVALTLTDDPAHAWRAQIFLNGWNLGQYINDVGPQHTFVLPNGVLDPRGTNTLALAVLADGSTPAGPGEVELTLLGAAAGGATPAVKGPGKGRPGRLGRHGTA
ncbi:glycoside hydrolase family 35 protein [Streptomyces odontomachi]|uniref:glycoside hydrolase family 35 protein n=1 Tax=Streptomyces odontomachi TaxID=2944940 RepID=UPI00210DF8A2|nr:beta-galactosidase [Streptomyces sp. ODS25]